MEYWKNKVAIVTGAGEGIGATIAEDLAKAGLTVLGFEPTQEKVSIIAQKLDTLGEIEGQMIPCTVDVSKEEDLELAFERIVAKYGGVDLLINNAAIGTYGMLSTGDIEDYKRVIDVNIYGVMACTRLAIAAMKENNKCGLIVNINSICGHYMPAFAEPKINMYVASKRMMTTMNKLLKKELKCSNSNIKVTSISPGIVRTGIFKTAGVEFLNEEFFNKNPHLTTKDVSDVVFIILKMYPNVQVDEILFHALHEIY